MHSPAWPALCAAVDETLQHHGWTPREILAAGLDGIPRDGTMSGVEVADALVLRIAALTDHPDDPPLQPHDGAADWQADPVQQIANDPYADVLTR